MDTEDEERTSWEIIASTGEKLKANGFDGLYSDGGECACDLSDLAPCGETEDGGDFINGCHGGYKHLDPRPEHARYGDWVISKKKEPLTDDEWENISYG